MALKRSELILGPECRSECSTLTDTLFETLFASDDDVETPPPKKSKLEVSDDDVETPPLKKSKLEVSDDDVETPPPKNSKLEVKCAELDISPGNLPMPPKKMNSAEDVSDSMSCSSWDAWKEKVNKIHEADKDAFTDDMDNMSCMDAWVRVCQSQWPLRG